MGQLKDSLVRDRFICGLSNTAVKEKLTATKGVTLEMAIDRCRMAEAAKEQVRVIERSGEGSVEAVRVTKESHQSRSPERSQGKCSRCGWSHGTRRCPALGKTCHTCKGIGHFSTMCRTTSKKAKALVQPVSVEDEVFAIGPIAEGLPNAQKNASADSKAFHVGAIDGPGASWRKSLSTNGRTVQYKLDTGAQVNILPYEVYQRFSPRPRLYMRHINQVVCVWCSPANSCEGTVYL